MEDLGVGTNARLYIWIFPSEEIVQTIVVEEGYDGDEGRAMESVSTAFTLMR